MYYSHQSVQLSVTFSDLEYLFVNDSGQLLTEQQHFHQWAELFPTHFTTFCNYFLNFPDRFPTNERPCWRHGGA